VTGRADTAVTGAGAVTGPAQRSVEQSRSVVDQAGQVTHRALDSVQAAEVVLARSEGAVTGAEQTVAAAGRTVGTADALVSRGEVLLGRVSRPVGVLLPSMQRLADAVTPGDADAVAVLLHRLPALLALVEDDVAPLARALVQVAPDLHNVLELLEDLHQLASGLPGAKRLRRRGEDDPDQPDPDQ